MSASSFAKSLNASGLLPVSRDDHYATALEPGAATVRTAPVDSSGFGRAVGPAGDVGTQPRS